MKRIYELREQRVKELTLKSSDNSRLWYVLDKKGAIISVSMIKQVCVNYIQGKHRIKFRRYGNLEYLTTPLSEGIIYKR